jgi:hypothetical protein
MLVVAPVETASFFGFQQSLVKAIIEIQKKYSGRRVSMSKSMPNVYASN